MILRRLKVLAQSECLCFEAVVEVFGGGGGGDDGWASRTMKLAGGSALA
jgi:hypothetical protein